MIALIAVPVMLNVIKRARKGAFEDSAYGVIDAVKLYYTDASLDGSVNEETFTFPTDKKLKLTGEKPKSGSAMLYGNGKVALAVGNGTWCAKKGKDEEKVTIVEYSVEDCKIEKSEPDEPSVSATAEACFTVSEDGSEITEYICEDKGVVIPSTINGIKIIKIGNRAFRDKQLTSIIIPNGITVIGDYAFSVNQLASVTIPNDVIEIGYGAFYNNQLISVTIPDGIESIGTSAFENNQLTSVKIPNSVIQMDYGAFSNNQLTSVTISTGLTKLESHAFSNNQLTSIVIPDNIERIDDCVFEDNQLTSIIIPNSVLIIGYKAFYNNPLKNITIKRVENSIAGAPWGATDATIQWTG